MNKKSVANHIFIIGCGISSITFMRPTEINITFTDVLLILSLILILQKKIYLHELFNNNLTLGAYKIAIFLFFSGFFISLYESNLESFLKSFAQYFICLFLLPILFSIFQHVNEKTALNSTLFLITTISLTGLLGFVGTALNPDILINYGLSSIDGRFTGFAGNPNIFAAYIGMTFPLVMHITNVTNIKFTYSLIIYVGYITGLLSTGSFGGIISSFVAASVYLAIRRTLIKPLIFIFSTIILLFTYSTYFEIPESFQKRVIFPVQDAISGKPAEIGSYDDRLKTNQEAFEIFSKSPIIGIGLDNYTKESKFQYTVHNTLLSVAVEGGIISLIGLLFLGLMPIINTITVKSIDRNIIATSASFTLALFATMQVYPHIYSRVWFIPYFLTILLTNKKYSNNPTARFT